jgi:hypothetical protein
MPDDNTDDESPYPAKVRISRLQDDEEIWQDEFLNIPVGLMFCAEDQQTKKPVICTITFAGILIEDFSSEITPKMLHEMVLQQQKHASIMADMILSNDAAMEAAKSLKAKVKEENNQDVV